MQRMATPEEILEIQTRVASLSVAIGSGARSITLGGQTIVYNSTASLIIARDDAVKQLTAATATKRRSRQIHLFQNGRGYD
jgi:hypothetical protein